MRKLGTAAAFAVIAVLALAIAGPAAAKDRNHDKIPDKWEKKYNLSLKVNQARKDQDKDGARNKAEYRAKTNPRSDDTDDDGVEDGDENAGTIESFDAATGVLVIDLFNGDTVTGTVDEDTEVECGCHGDTGDAEEGDDDSSEDTSARDEGPGDGDEDHSGPGGPEGDHSGPGGPEGEGPHGSPCTVDDLIAGATVHEAELKTTADGLVYTEVELVKDDPADDDSDDDSSDDDSSDDDS